MVKFNELGLSENILKAIEKMGFEAPTPVQEKVIPHLLQSEKSLVALAQTGTGKTAAFGLPLLELLQPNEKKIKALILCPTRELCLQIAKDLENYSSCMNKVKILAVYGGAPIVNQMRQLKDGVNIVVGTPGRMNDLIRRKKINLTSVDRVVLDEADEMLNMGFKEDLDFILEHIPETAKTLLFSATMPKAVAAIAKNYMHNPEEITIGRKNSGADNVTHQYCMVHARDRYLALKRIADCFPDMYGLVFCRTRAETQEIADKLMHDGYNADAIHGDLSQPQRDRVMDKFRKKQLQMLVATDVAARGVDVSALSHVINYNLPDDPEIYTHRSGRTGRAGKTGLSVSIIHMKEVFKIKQIERKLGKKFEKISVPSGKMICEAQLFSMVNKVKNISIDHEQIDPYLPAVSQILEGMSKEELIKHFVSVEFNRFLKYYKNAPDLNASGNPRDSKGFDRLGNSNVASFHINMGKADGLTPKSLLQLINDNCPGKINVGRIKITETFSLVEVDKDQESKFTKSLNNSIFIGDRQVQVRPDSKPSGDSFGRKRRRPSRGNSDDRRNSGRKRSSNRNSSKPSRSQRSRSKK